MIDKLKQLVSNVKNKTDDLQSSIDDIDNKPNIINVIYNDDVNSNRIVVELDNPLPDGYKIVIKDINSGDNQPNIQSSSSNTYNINTYYPVITPFLVTITDQEMPNHLTIFNSDSITPVWTSEGSPLQYMLGDGGWMDAVSGESITTEDTIRFRGTGRTNLFIAESDTNKWTVTGSNVVISGNFNCLLDYINPTTNVSNYGFQCMFYQQTSIRAVEAILPAKIIGRLAYANMFGGCTNLITAPELPATTIDEFSYNGMFGSCSNLVNGPSVLPATVMKTCSYQGMFGACSDLYYPPVIMATTLTGNNCFAGMFSGCTKLLVAPELPITNLCYACYYQMFNNCKALVDAPNLPATTLQTDCYRRMFKGCTALYSAPNSDLYTTYEPAQNEMFNNCTALDTPVSYDDIPVNWK